MAETPPSERASSVGHLTMAELLAESRTLADLLRGWGDRDVDELREVWRAQVTRWMRKRWSRDPVCPYCSDVAWKVQEEPAELLSAIDSERVMRVAQVACGNCGHIVFLSPHAIELSKDEGG
jgi:hypothetical protein